MLWKGKRYREQEEREWERKREKVREGKVEWVQRNGGGMGMGWTEWERGTMRVSQEVGGDGGEGMSEGRGRRRGR